MKNLYFLLVIIICTNSLYAAWEPFPLNQKSYYAYLSGTDSLINSVYMDTIVQRNGYEAIFFNHKYYGYDIGTCYSTIVNVDQPTMQFGIGEIEFDSLVISGDTLFYTPPFNFTKYLLLNPTPGQSWPFNNDTLTYSSDSVMQILGNMDSVKIYTGLSSPIILSKTYGFISYPQFNSISTVMHSLVGFSDSSGVYGWIKPMFMDFFPYQPGDILVWEFKQEPPFSPQVLYWRRDSITAVSAGPDSITYSYDYVQYDGDTTIYGTGGVYYFDYNLPNQLEAPTNWLAYGHPYTQQIPISGTNSYILKSDSSIGYSFADNGNYIDTTNCTLGQVIDAGLEWYFDTQQGFLGTFSGVFYPISQTLMGSIINGVIRGDTTLHLGLDEIALEDIGIYPNPASQFMNVILNERLEGFEYSIIDITVSKVKTGSLTNTMMDVRNLNNGIYFLEIRNGNKIGTAKFLIQR